VVLDRVDRLRGRVHRDALLHAAQEPRDRLAEAHRLERLDRRPRVLGRGQRSVDEFAGQGDGVVAAVPRPQSDDRDHGARQDAVVDLAFHEPVDPGQALGRLSDILGLVHHDQSKNWD
jgi:hypothetical protein